MDSIVAIDVETTGLDYEKDAIIEIGAVKFNPRRIEKEWSRLINPGRPIPPFVTQLTGITDQMVVNSSYIEDVIPEFVDFIKDAHIVGHNVKFDLSFLNRHGVLSSNSITDTYEIAAVILPTAPRYSLSSLAMEYGILLPAIHRALPDAHATRGIYLRLYEEILKLPIDLLIEIVHLSENLDWGAYWAFRQALASRSKEISSPDQVKYRNQGPIFEDRYIITGSPLQPREIQVPLDIEEVSAILDYGGQLNRYFPNYEYRSQQISMLQAVAKALTESKHLMVEAGTGTGKSLAYLIPAIQWALKNDQRVVISTNTINLQDQLVNKDIPDLQKALGINLNYIVLKGRANYLCPRRFENFHHKGPENVDEVRVLAKVMVWLRGTYSGDRSELNLNSPSERDIWMKICAEDEGCTTDNCFNRMGGICPFYRVHQAAEGAQLVIINHALLLADVATGNRVLPNYDYIIIDEAHHLEEATTNALSYKITQIEIGRLLKSLGGPNSGILGRSLIAAKDIFNPADFALLSNGIQKTTDSIFRVESMLSQFFSAIDQYLFEIREGRPIGTYAIQERIVSASRTQPAWADIEQSWEEVEILFITIKESIEKVLQALTENISHLAVEDEELISGLSMLVRKISELQDNIHAIVFQPKPDQIYWIEQKNNNQGLSLHIAPLHIGPLMQKFLWNEKKSVILTSATLTAAGDFTYLRNRLNGEDAEELALGSPFDYQNSTLVYIANDIPEPSDRYGYQKSVERCLVQLCRATGGRTLALFTSYDQLRRTSQAIGSLLSKDNIIVYEQGEGASPHSLLESFRIADKAILMGTRAFWEGIDVPGEALSVLVIVKLPFDVPTDPIISSRSETFEDPFYEYSLPEAILRFRQGFGRLIRLKSDRGFVLILDRRIISKKYGPLFIKSLPECTFITGPLANIPNQAKQFLNL